VSSAVRPTSPRPGPFIGGMSRFVWQWVRRQIYAEVVAAGFGDLKPAHVYVFRYPSSEGLRPTELADEMQITKQSVNELLGYLEEHGYLVRKPDPTDSRSRRIHLTDLGRELEETCWRAAEGAERTVATLLGEDRLLELRCSLVDLMTALGSSAAVGGTQQDAPLA